jgi:hypothetical protein
MVLCKCLPYDFACLVDPYITLLRNASPFVRFDVLTAVTMCSTVLWDVASCHLVDAD